MIEHFAVCSDSYPHFFRIKLNMLLFIRMKRYLYLMCLMQSVSIVDCKLKFKNIRVDRIFSLAAN